MVAGACPMLPCPRLRLGVDDSRCSWCDRHRSITQPSPPVRRRVLELPTDGQLGARIGAPVWIRTAIPRTPRISDTLEGPPQPPPRGGEGWRRQNVAFLSLGIAMEVRISTPDILGFGVRLTAQRPYLFPSRGTPRPVRLTASGQHPSHSSPVLDPPHGARTVPVPRQGGFRNHTAPL